MPSPTILLENPGVQNGNPDTPKVILQSPLGKRLFLQLMRHENWNPQQLAPEDPPETQRPPHHGHTHFLPLTRNEGRQKEGALSWAPTRFERQLALCRSSHSLLAFPPGPGQWPLSYTFPFHSHPLPIPQHQLIKSSLPLASLLPAEVYPTFLAGASQG